MSSLSISQLQAHFVAKKYIWHPHFNLIGIRNKVDVPDSFNDMMVCAWLQPAIPAESNNTILNQQRWLNDFFYVGIDGKPLVEDGQAGKNTTFALQIAAKQVGTWRMKSWTITTDPGVYYLQQPINAAIGCAVVKPGQYPSVWRLGFHQGKQAHPALVQQGGVITVYLDNDRDKYAEASKTEKSGYFGINCHHASETIVSTIIGKWSAGCQVFPSKIQHQELLQLCRQYQASLKNFFTYTLLLESEL